MKNFVKIAPLVAVLAACGGKVVVDGPGLGGNTGGTGGTTTWSYPTTTYYGGYYTGGYYTGGYNTGGYYTGGYGGTGGDGCGGQPPDQCSQCCVDAHSSGYQTYLYAFVKECACASPQLKCYQACAQDACLNPNNLGPQCSNCLSQIQSDPCANQVVNECYAAADCAALLDCVQVCQ